MLPEGWLGLTGDEGPGKLGKVRASRMQTSNPESPNGTSLIFTAKSCESERGELKEKKLIKQIKNI